jgi:hypothetical protein
MGLGFLVPAFLAGLTALLVPVVLHLRHRERDLPFRFPSLMFLRRIPIRTARRRRITDWILLLLRASVLAVLVAAFARPFLGRAETTAGAAPARAVVILLDRSLSMGYRGVWPAALDSARAVVASLAPADRAALVLFDIEAEVAQPLTADRGAVLGALSSAASVSRGTRYAAALRTARQLLAGTEGQRGEVVVITDLQRSGLAGLAGLELPADILVRSISVAPTLRGNTALIGAEVQRVPDGERSRLLVSARLSSRELVTPRRARLSLTVNGRAAGAREVTLPADGPLAVAFDAVPLPAGRARGTITLEPDGLPGDDTFRFVVPAETALRVLLLAPGDAGEEETLYLQRALGIGREPRIAIERRVAGALDARTLRGASAVILLDAPLPSGTVGARLDVWIRAGGGLVVAAGRRLAARGVSAGALLPGAVRGVIERTEDHGGTIGEVSLDHPIFTPFRDAAGALGAARFLRYPRLEPVPGATVLARFDDGVPALLEVARGSGQVLLLGIPLDAINGDFPLQPAYLPFLRRLAVFAAGHDVAPLWRITGESGLLPEGVREPVIATPGGALLRPAPDSGRRAMPFAESGFYEVYEGRAAGEPREVFAVNPPAAESDLTPADPRELLLGVRRSDSLHTAAAPPPTAAEREGRQRLWRILLTLAALLLLLETLVANRGRRASATSVVPAPPEGSAS